MERKELLRHAFQDAIENRLALIDAWENVRDETGDEVRAESNRMIKLYRTQLKALSGTKMTNSETDIKKIVANSRLVGLDELKKLTSQS